MRIYIVRHGETVENRLHILQGHLPGTLTLQGTQQVAQSAAELEAMGVSFSCIVSSDLQRAMDSAQIIAQRLHLPVVPMRALRERDWGQFTGMSIAEATKRFRIDGRWRFPAGTTETEPEIYERAGKALDELSHTYPDASVVVVTHGQLARNMVAAHRHCSYHEVEPFKNAEIRILEL